jgi:hypothetical protein
MEELNPRERRNRVETGKKSFKKKKAENFSSIKGYGVARCVLDVIDDIWSNNEAKRIRDRE